jgi:hypothetical protein
MSSVTMVAKVLLAVLAVVGAVAHRCCRRQPVRAATYVTSSAASYVIFGTATIIFVTTRTSTSTCTSTCTNTFTSTCGAYSYFEGGFASGGRPPWRCRRGRPQGRPGDGVGSSPGTAETELVHSRVERPLNTQHNHQQHHTSSAFSEGQPTRVPTTAL